MKKKRIANPDSKAFGLQIRKSKVVQCEINDNLF